MVKIVCIGDSITAGAPLVGTGKEWVTLLQSKLGKRAMLINRGIGGDTTAGMIARFQADVVAEKPDYVIIAGGLNDQWLQVDFDAINAVNDGTQFTADPDRYGQSAATIYGHLVSLIQMAKMANIKPMIVLETGVNPAITPRPNSVLKAVWTDIAAYAVQNNIPVIDWFGLMWDGQRYRTEYVSPDCVHPSEQGHSAISDATYAMLNKLVN
jgi:lysophospholipase L1-like esterase